MALMNCSHDRNRMKSKILALCAVLYVNSAAAFWGKSDDSIGRPVTSDEVVQIVKDMLATYDQGGADAMLAAEGVCWKSLADPKQTKLVPMHCYAMTMAAMQIQVRKASSKKGPSSKSYTLKAVNDRVGDHLNDELDFSDRQFDLVNDEADRLRPLIITTLMKIELKELKK